MKKLEPGTKVKIIAREHGHKLNIGSTYYISKYEYYDPDARACVYLIEGRHVTEEEFEVVQDTFKVGDVIKFKTGNTRYVIVEVLDTEYKYKHLGNGKIFGCSKDSAIEVLEKTSEDYEYIFKNCKFILDTIEWKEWYNNFIGNNISTTFNFGDIVKIIDEGRMASTFDEAAEAMGLTKWVRANWTYSNEEIKTIFKFNYYKVIGSYKHIKTLYIGIENLFNGDQYIITEEGIEHTLTPNLTFTNTGIGCIDYPISYADTSQVSVNNKGENTLLTNNNTMEKLNQLRADKFFAKEKNLVAIESLDTLLNDSVQLIVSTENELKKTKEKLHGLNRKLEAATNTQDVAMLKDLIASTKVIQEFVDELKSKTISKFEQAKTKFDVAGYLKD